MSLTKLESYNLMGLGREIAKELTGLEDKTILYIPNDHTLVENIETVKPEIFLKFSDENAYLYGSEAPSHLFIVNTNKNHGRTSFEVDTDKAVLSGFTFFTYFIFDSLTFIKNMKNQFSENSISLDYVMEKIGESIKKNILKCYTNGDDEESLAKKVKMEINYQLDEMGIKIEDFNINGFTSIISTKPQTSSESEIPQPSESDSDEIILDMVEEDGGEILIDDDEEDLFGEPAKPRCKKCGYIPDGKIPKFCPECGNKFDF